MIEFLSLIATLVTACIAALIAYQANRLQQMNLSLESDKIYLEWGQRCIDVVSKIVTLRSAKMGEIMEEEFTDRRRRLRTELYSCIAQGQLLLKERGVEAVELIALRKIVEQLSSHVCRPPHEGSEAQDQLVMTYFRDELENFITALQDRLPDDWVH